jgi:hypothetical protein
MGTYALFDAARGTWVTKAEKAAKERYALVSFQGTVKQVIEVDGAEEVPHKAKGRHAHRTDRAPLSSGSIVHKYVGKHLPHELSPSSTDTSRRRYLSG